jgi:hypothetical protein
MKNKILFAVVIFCTYAIFSVSANEFSYAINSVLSLEAMEDVSEDKSQHEKIAMPGKSDVLIVGRISVKADEDMQFYAKTRNVNPENLTKDAVLLISADDESQRQIYTDGEFFFVKYRLPKNRHIQFDSVPYYFFADKKTSLILPMGFSIDVPKDVNYVYIGSFTYNITGDDFTVKNITVSDEYDQAQQLADKITGKNNIELCRVELKAYDEKTAKTKK